MPTTWTPPDPMIPHGAHLPLGTGKGLNAFLLKELCKHYMEGYDDDTYMVHIRDAYKQLWEEVMQLDEEFFTDVIVLTVNTTSDTFDLYNNIYGTLTFGIPRIHQIHRIRVQQPPSGTSTDNQYFSADPRDFNDPEYLASSQTQPPIPSTVPPYYYVPFGRNSIKFARPLTANTLIELWVTYSALDLNYVNAGTITTTGSNNVVTGSSTNFTYLTTPDLQAALPNSTTPVEQQIDVEIIIAGQSYTITNITSDTAANTLTNVPAVTNGSYILASLPELPGYEHRLIAQLAAKNLAIMGPMDLSPVKVAELNRLCDMGVMRMKNTMMQRQRQSNSKKRRFPYGVVRRSRFFGAR